ncbi:PP2C family serine/threonine-protein phosphatase [Halalkalibacterium ligniniphilum]|uniref:PP2C family serine/threonine-protein phosphatase n=1 Tax=Halalkalibacterium ligniniphilum TaxID=1134413 RepID=UPI00034D9CEB|nr:PP2C family serine/threonine-protein phosphatase [Halalkalibacterium ligniniphilum]
MMTFFENDKLEIAALQKAKLGKSCCGDAYVVIREESYALCAVVDGLGSGEGASKSALKAVRMIEAHHDKDVRTIVEKCNAALTSMRGVVLTVVKFDFTKQELCYSNIGNIRFVLHSPDGTSLEPLPVRGYLSGRKQNITMKRFPYKHGSAFMLHSDGIQAPPKKTFLMKMESPKEMPNELISTFDNPSDDMTILVGKLL